MKPKMAVTCPRFSGPKIAGKFQFSGVPIRAVGRGLTMKKSKFSEAQIAFILRQGDEGTAEARFAGRLGSVRRPITIGASSTAG